MRVVLIFELLIIFVLGCSKDQSIPTGLSTSYGVVRGVVYQNGDPCCGVHITAYHLSKAGVTAKTAAAELNVEASKAEFSISLMPGTYMLEFYLPYSINGTAITKQKYVTILEGKETHCSTEMLASIQELAVRTNGEIVELRSLYTTTYGTYNVELFRKNPDGNWEKTQYVEFFYRYYDTVTTSGTYTYLLRMGCKPGQWVDSIFTMVNVESLMPVITTGNAVDSGSVYHIMAAQNNSSYGEVELIDNNYSLIILRSSDSIIFFPRDTVVSSISSYNRPYLFEYFDTLKSPRPKAYRFIVLDNKTGQVGNLSKVFGLKLAVNSVSSSYSISDSIDFLFVASNTTNDAEKLLKTGSTWEWLKRANDGNGFVAFDTVKVISTGKLLTYRRTKGIYEYIVRQIPEGYQFGSTWLSLNTTDEYVFSPSIETATMGNGVQVSLKHNMKRTYPYLLWRNCLSSGEKTFVDTIPYGVNYLDTIPSRNRGQYYTYEAVTLLPDGKFSFYAYLRSPVVYPSKIPSKPSISVFKTNSNSVSLRNQYTSGSEFMSYPLRLLIEKVNSESGQGLKIFDTVRANSLVYSNNILEKCVFKAWYEIKQLGLRSDTFTSEEVDLNGKISAPLLVIRNDSKFPVINLMCSAYDFSLTNNVVTFREYNGKKDTLYKEYRMQGSSVWSICDTVKNISADTITYSCAFRSLSGNTFGDLSNPVKVVVP
ncbi:MAG: hypothetical protein JNL74_16695 [Fibrobacteres bacterium]|nr:hypothetical protein [Fibrobacterota bacterium]